MAKKRGHSGACEEIERAGEFCKRIVEASATGGPDAHGARVIGGWAWGCAEAAGLAY